MILRGTIIIYYETLPQCAGTQFGLISRCDRHPTYREFHPTLFMAYPVQLSLWHSTYWEIALQ